MSTLSHCLNNAGSNGNGDVDGGGGGGGENLAYVKENNTSLVVSFEKY